jgi:hypothetical protein
MCFVSSLKAINDREKFLANKEMMLILFSESKDVRQMMQETNDGRFLRVKLSDSRIHWSNYIE